MNCIVHGVTKSSDMTERLSLHFKPVNPKRNQPWIFTRSTDAEAPILWSLDAKSVLMGKDPDVRKDWRQKGSNRGWDGWMASLTQWTWVWANSRRWWRTGKPGVLQSVGSQRVWHEWVTEKQPALQPCPSQHTPSQTTQSAVSSTHPRPMCALSPVPPFKLPPPYNVLTYLSKPTASFRDTSGLSSAGKPSPTTWCFVNALLPWTEIFKHGGHCLPSPAQVADPQTYKLHTGCCFKLLHLRMVSLQMLTDRRGSLSGQPAACAPQGKRWNWRPKHTSAPTGSPPSSAHHSRLVTLAFCCSLNKPRISPPQDTCICSSLHPESSFLRTTPHSLSHCKEVLYSNVTTSRKPSQVTHS